MQRLRTPLLSIVLLAALAAPLLAVTTDELAKKVSALATQVAALQTQVDTLKQQMAQQQAAVKIAGGTVTVTSSGTLELKGALVKINGGGRPVVGGPVALPSGTPICTAPDHGGPCPSLAVLLAPGAPTVLVP